MAHTKHTRIARQLQSELGIPYQQALEHVRAGRDRELLAAPRRASVGTHPSIVYVVGFVSDSGTGGFEFNRSRTVIEQKQAELIAEGDNDVSDVVEVDLQALDPDLDGNDLAAVEEALDSDPDLWEPTYGQNRPGAPEDFRSNPGHPDAVAAGCTCDPAANRHGQLADDELNVWKVSSSCPLHGFVAGWTARQARRTS